MRELALIGFLVALLMLALKRPFLFTLAYIYVDTVSPQRLSYLLLNRVPVSMIVAALAIGSWLVMDKKEGRPAPRQGLMALLLLYVFWTTLYADMPVEAWTKWDWVWKAMIFAIFLPFTLRTRLRSEERRVGKECRYRCDWSSDVCSSYLDALCRHAGRGLDQVGLGVEGDDLRDLPPLYPPHPAQIGRASCRERV